MNYIEELDKLVEIKGYSYYVMKGYCSVTILKNGLVKNVVTKKSDSTENSIKRVLEKLPNFE